MRRKATGETRFSLPSFARNRLRAHRNAGLPRLSFASTRGKRELGGAGDPWRCAVICPERKPTGVECDPSAAVGLTPHDRLERPSEPPRRSPVDLRGDETRSLLSHPNEPGGLRRSPRADRKASKKNGERVFRSLTSEMVGASCPPRSCSCKANGGTRPVPRIRGDIGVGLHSRRSTPIALRPPSRERLARSGRVTANDIPIRLSRCLLRRQMRGSFVNEVIRILSDGEIRKTNLCDQILGGKGRRCLPS